MATAAPFFSVAAPTPAHAAGWAASLQTLLALLGRHFARSEARTHLGAYLTGLLSPIERKNGWHLAEQAGDATPYALQHLLGRSRWDADAVRDDLQAYVRASLADPAGVLVIDETSFLKKGSHSVGVGIQYSGVTGKLENCQVGVFLAYVGPRGQALYDRAPNPVRTVPQPVCTPCTVPDAEPPFSGACADRVQTDEAIRTRRGPTPLHTVVSGLFQR